MRRFVPDTQDGQSYDSFLDIVANLVGILVILIMVIGMRARDAWMSGPLTSPPHSDAAEAAVDPQHVIAAEDAPSATSASPRELDAPPVDENVAEARIAAEDWRRLRENIESAAAQAVRLNSDLRDMDQEIERLTERVALQAEEREQLQLMVVMAERALESRRQEFSRQQQERLAIARQEQESLAELARLQGQKETLLAEAAPSPVLTHYPRPLAKTVFGTEEHFRLLGGRLAYVPIREMTQMLQRDAEKKLWKLEQANQVTEVLGPVSGFRMKYTLHRVERRVSTESGWRLLRTIELQRFVMVPESTDLGISWSEALQPTSEFAQRLATFTPGDTTITVWTYPDSFEEFRQLKGYLYERGFVAAARPLPHDYPIGGSPQGSKSAAQ